ncbi:uncharacterized protein LOC100184116 [Ciona intestinalis]
MGDQAKGNLSSSSYDSWSVVAAGYVDPRRSVDEHRNHRRITDGALHWQHRPRVYPFNEAKSSSANVLTPKDRSQYKSDFIQMQRIHPDYRPSSLNRRNNPHPNQAFHVKHMLNQKVPVVRTRMTLEEFNRKPMDSPYESNTHRVYRRYRQSEIVRAKPSRKVEAAVSGIVPELNENDDPALAKLFPVIPRNARLTADRAQELTNSVITPRKNKHQPHLSANASGHEQVFPHLPIKDLNKPSLKPVQGRPNAIEASSWEPTPSARTTSRVFGRKRADPNKVEDEAKAIVPELPTPKSKSLMFKEYAQYPKYAPQMISDFYSGKTRKGVTRPYVY